MPIGAPNAHAGIVPEDHRGAHEVLYGVLELARVGGRLAVPCIRRHLGRSLPARLDRRELPIRPRIEREGELDRLHAYPPEVKVWLRVDARALALALVADDKLNGREGLACGLGHRNEPAPEGMEIHQGASAPLLQIVDLRVLAIPPEPLAYGV